MKKVLLAGTALVGLAAFAAPAHAELKTELGGFFRGYGVYADNDPTGATSLQTVAIRRDSEIHFTGETTLDNGLTVGVHTEVKLGSGAASGSPAVTPAYGNAVTTDEAYAYFSGGWGRFNLGAEDGSAYLLQVAAPSADSNVDGLRTYIQDLTPRTALPANFTAIAPGAFTSNVLKYDDVSDPTGAPNTTRLTYLSPKFSGFQAGISYAPGTGVGDGQGLGVAGPVADNGLNLFNDVWEGSARWDGEFQGFGIGLGGGYSKAGLEARGAAAIDGGVGNNIAGGLGGLSDDYITWNGGINLTWGGFSLGGAYTHADTTEIEDGTAGVGLSQGHGDITMETWAVGGAWDNGPYHVGASYLNRNTTRDAAAGVVSLAGAHVNEDAERWTIGGGYTYGPGMTFRGAAAFGSFDPNSATANLDNNFTQVTVGTDIQF